MCLQNTSRSVCGSKTLNSSYMNDATLHILRTYTFLLLTKLTKYFFKISF